MIIVPLAVLYVTAWLIVAKSREKLHVGFKFQTVRRAREKARACARLPMRAADS